MATTISKDFGVRVKTYRVSVEKYDEVEAAVAQVVQDFGRLDVMIVNAGIPSKAGGLDDKLDSWNRVRSVDFDGAYYCARAAGYIFKSQGYGNCIFTASMSGHAVNVPQEQSCYNACKAGVVRKSNLSKSFWKRDKTDAIIRYTCQNLWLSSGPNLVRDATPSLPDTSTQLYRANVQLR